MPKYDARYFLFVLPILHFKASEHIDLLLIAQWIINKDRSIR